MTYKQATEILLRAAGRDVRGAGLGIRSNTDKQRHEVARAMRIVFKRTYGREMDDNDEFNYGINYYHVESKP